MTARRSPVRTLRPVAARAATPLADALRAYADRGVTALHTPAHKQGRAAIPALRALVGDTMLQVDQPSLYALDNTFHPHGCIARAEAHVAATWGAGHSFLLASGSSTAVKAALLSVANDGDAVVVGRDAHKSAHAGLVLAGAVPVFPRATVHPEAGALPPTRADIESALDDTPGARAVLITRPTYYGLLGDLRPIVDLCRERELVLIVDEAHGAHLQWLPGPRPRTALESGADIVIQSPHKTLGALVGGALLHLRRDGPVEVDTVRRNLNLLRSTSPSYPVLASLDLVRAWCDDHGVTAFGQAADMAAHLRRRVAAIDGYSVVGSDLPRGCATDAMRLIIGVSGRGTNGYAVERHLRARGIEAEFADARSIGFVLGPWDGDVVDALVDGLSEIGTPEAVPDSANLQVPGSVPSLSPRIASRSPTVVVPTQLAVGRIVAEPVTAYPPGIPLLCPGETVTLAALRRCDALRELGAVVYASDPSLATLVVVELP